MSRNKSYQERIIKRFMSAQEYDRFVNSYESSRHASRDIRWQERNKDYILWKEGKINMDILKNRWGISSDMGLATAITKLERMNFDV